MNKLIALPTPETLELLTTVMAASPVAIDFDSLFIEIGVSHGPVAADPTRQYTASTVGLNVWYETATGRSFLIAPLTAGPELVARHREVGDVYRRPTYVPYLVLTADPLLRRHRRAWINSIAESFAFTPKVLSFHNELVVEENGVVPPHADFYADYTSGW